MKSCVTCGYSGEPVLEKNEDHLIEKIMGAALNGLSVGYSQP